MKSKPQLENGYTQLSNELLEAFARIRISGECWQCLNVIIRKTYGFKKTEDWISLSQFEEATKSLVDDDEKKKKGLNKAAICRALKKMQNMDIIIKNDNGNRPKYGIQKDYSRWKPLSKKITYSPKIDKEIIKNDTSEPLSKKTIEIDNNDNLGVSILPIKEVSKMIPTITSLEKDNLQNKVVQNRELLIKIKKIKKQFDEYVLNNQPLIIEEAEIVFAKSFDSSSDDVSGFDEFMDYWIRKEINKMRDWILKDTEKSINLSNHQNFIKKWFEREKPYPAFLSAADEKIYYEIQKGQHDVR